MDLSAYVPEDQKPIKPTKPYALSMPNVPKPLHGVAPRTFMTASGWNSVKKNTQDRAKGMSDIMHCEACGRVVTHVKGDYLHAHELYAVDYNACTATFLEFVGLCQDCHNFIHSGRLAAIFDRGEVSREYVIGCLEKGLRVCTDNGVPVSMATYKLMRDMGITDTKIICVSTIRAPYTMDEIEIEHWSDWRMIYDGKEHGPKFKSYEEWAEFYENKPEGGN